MPGTLRDPCRLWSRLQGCPPPLPFCLSTPWTPSKTKASLWSWPAGLPPAAFFASFLSEDPGWLRGQLLPQLPAPGLGLMALSSPCHGPPSPMGSGVGTGEAPRRILPLDLQGPGTGQGLAHGNWSPGASVLLPGEMGTMAASPSLQSPGLFTTHQATTTTTGAHFRRLPSLCGCQGCGGGPGMRPAVPRPGLAVPLISPICSVAAVGVPLSQPWSGAVAGPQGRRVWKVPRSTLSPVRVTRSGSHAGS